MLTYEQYYNGLSNDKEKGIASWITRMFAGRNDEIKVLEIGSGWGIYAGALLRCTSDKWHLTSIDTRPKLPQFVERTEGFEHRITRLTVDSKEFLPDQPTNHYDLIIIDGNHEYEGFKSDFELSWPILKDYGMIIVDDVLHKHNFDSDYGITKALSELAIDYGFEFTVYPVASGIATIMKLPK